MSRGRAPAVERRASAAPGVSLAVAAAIGAIGCAGEPVGGGGDDPCGASVHAGTPYVCRVVSFTAGTSAGFGEESFPSIVYGPPRGAGTKEGSLDVLSLGVGGEIVVVLGAAITDGEGPDLLVFENAFHVSDDPEKPFTDLGSVAVSQDGEEFHEFACEPAEYRTTSCAGWRPVLSSPDNGIPPTDPAAAGGDAFDLAELGLAEARYVRVRDLAQAGGGINAGFDLDAMAAVPR